MGSKIKFIVKTIIGILIFIKLSSFFNIYIGHTKNYVRNKTSPKLKIVSQESYWENYYDSLINRTEIVNFEPYDLQISQQCEGSFDNHMEENIKTVLSYPVIAKAKAKYSKLFEVFGQAAPSTREQANQSHPVIVTAASSAHFPKSLAMIKSFKDNLLPQYKGMKMIYFDIGLTRSQLEQLKMFCPCEIRTFPFHDFPPYVSNLQNYVWKPIIIYMILKEYNFIMWADASINFNGNKIATDNFFKKAKETGILVTRLGDVCRSFYHTKEETFKHLNETPCLFELHQTEATFITIWKTSFTWNYIIQPWLACALTENCVSHRNPKAVLHCRKRSKTTFHWCHRFDQSVLSIILQRLYGKSYDIVALNRLPRIAKIDRDQYLYLRSRF